MRLFGRLRDRCAAPWKVRAEKAEADAERWRRLWAYVKNDFANCALGVEDEPRKTFFAQAHRLMCSVEPGVKQRES